MKSKAGPPRVIDSPNLPRDIRVKVTLVTRPLLKPFAQKLWMCEHGAFSSRMCMFILEHYLASKLIVQFVKHFPEKEVLDNTMVVGWCQNLGTQEVSVCDKCSSSDKSAQITAVPISSSASAATTGYGCKNSILPLVSWSCCVVVFLRLSVLSVFMVP
jgi:hypothetical protein